MTEKRFTLSNRSLNEVNTTIAIADDGIPCTQRYICKLLNELNDENKQLKQDKFICLDCEHSGYTEIGCLCEKKDHWTDYKTECEDYEKLK